MDASTAAIEFALDADEGMEFLRCWNEGDFDACRREWPEAPEECYIGADPAHPKTAGVTPSVASEDVLTERRRQIEQEGFDHKHDDQDDQPGDLARAAACYAIAAAYYPHDDVAIVRFWPWLDTWWKPTDRRRNLVKAGALIIAEIERLDRTAVPTSSETA